MAISFIGSSSAAAGSVALPAHSAGDLIVIYAYRFTSAVQPTLVDGYTYLTGGAANTNGDILAYKFATSSDEVSGSWVNAQLIAAHVYRGVAGVGNATGTTNATSPVAFNAVQLSVTDGSSWVARFVGARIQTQSIETPPAGHVMRTNWVGTTGEIAGFDTDAGTASAPAVTGGTTGNSRWRVAGIEIIAAPPLTGSGSGNLSAVTGGATGRMPIAGAASASLASFTGSATGRLLVRGTGAGALSAFDGASQAALPFLGQGGGTLDVFTGDASGSLRIVAWAGGALDDFTGSAGALRAVRGDAAGSLDSFTGGAGGLLGDPPDRTPDAAWVRTIKPRRFSIITDGIRAFTLVVRPRRFVLLSSGCTKMLHFPGKHAREVRYAEVNFAPDLSTGETLTGTPEITGDGDIAVSDEATMGNAVRFTLRGGSASAAEIQHLSILVNTSTGQVLEEVVQVTMLS